MSTDKRLSAQLLTFAITLSLLLSISLAILLRNLVLRMRERRIRDAVAAGLLPPESLGWIYRAQLGILSVARPRPVDVAGSHMPRVIGPKPSLWDAWVQDTEKGLAPKGRQIVEPSWEGVIPLSLTPLETAADTSKTTPEPVTAELPRRNFLEVIFQLPAMPHIPDRPPSTAQPTLTAVASAEAERQRQERLIADLFEPTVSRAVTPANASTSDTTTPTATHGVRVALFVAMPRDPALGRPQPHNEEDPLDGLDVVLGTSDVMFDRQRPPPGTPAAPPSPIASTSVQR
ncbi:hypothetical protein BKA62DRAFT_191501 [Auriculariales sp. MPI-PUGE-AT-0066]|nr:hypothetical protein BKA62DRAFT_191501 [Auriculariales sp. MPI-PUGE-AT-0066]